jgi:hypothetical protein
LNQNSEPAVQPRRNLLTALWVSVAGLWGSSRLVASTIGAETSHGAQTVTCEDTLKDYELTLIVGRLCLDEGFRKAFFESRELDAKALELLSKKKMLTRTDMIDSVDKILKAHKSPTNPVKDAVDSLSAALVAAGIHSCPDWPC